MRKALMAVGVTLGLSGCLVNPSFSMWNSNDQGAENTCLPFAADGGVGSGVISGALSFTIAGSHHGAFSPRAENGTKFLNLELDEPGTACHRSPEANANQMKSIGTQTISIRLIAAADAGWEGTYTLTSASTTPGTGSATYAQSSCQPLLGVLGDCSRPTLALEGTLTIETVAPCALTGRFEFVDVSSDGGASSGSFTSVYCRGID